VLLWCAIKPLLFSLLLPLAAAPPGAFLATPLPEVRPISQAELAPRGEDGRTPPRAAVPNLPPDPLSENRAPGADRIAVPNSDGVIDLAALDAADPPGTIPNPFVVRYRPPASIREVSLTIDGVLISKNAGDDCAIVNGDVYSRGDALAGLVVESIAPDAIELRSDGVRLRIPVADRPVRLRLPR